MPFSCLTSKSYVKLCVHLKSLNFNNKGVLNCKLCLSPATHRQINSQMGGMGDQKLQNLQALRYRHSIAEINCLHFLQASLTDFFFLCRHFNILRGTHCAQECKHTHSAAAEKRSEQSVTITEEMQKSDTAFKKLL